jgi:hypothetical protein
MKQVCVIGERVSGTCYLQSLLLCNTSLKLVSPYGHKHFYQDTARIRKDAQPDTLFIFISRDLIEWLHSFKNNTFHADKPIRNCQDMSTFLRMEWKCIHDATSGTPESSPLFGKEMMCERNPDNGERFPDVIRMRNSKMKHFMSIGQLVPNFMHVRYEDVRDNPREFLKNLSTDYHVSLSTVFRPVDTVRGKGRVLYVRKNYPEMDKEDMDFILDRVDADLETSLGYL